MTAVVISVMALIIPTSVTASTTWVTDRAGGWINVFSAAAVSSMADHPDETVRYGSGPDETAQIYRPRNHDAPVLVDIHGGGWNTNATMPATLRWFSDHGWLVIRPSYTLASKGHPTWDIAPKQVACAWAWSLSHAKELGGDPSRVSIMGDSAGGGMAINLAYGAASGKLTSSCGPVRAPKSVLALYPTVDVAAVQSVTTLGAGNAATKYTGGTPQQFPDRYRAVNSSTWITAKAPPTMVIQGNHDTFVPPSSVRDFVARARPGRTSRTCNCQCSTMPSTPRRETHWDSRPSPVSGRPSSVSTSDPPVSTRAKASRSPAMSVSLFWIHLICKPSAAATASRTACSSSILSAILTTSWTRWRCLSMKACAG